MKVLLVNSSNKGGAATACLRLAEGLANLPNLTCTVLLNRKEGHVNNAVVFNTKKKATQIKDKLKRIFWELKLAGKPKTWKEQRAIIQQQYFKEAEFFSLANTDYDITQSKHYQEADIIHLHWVSNFMDYATFFKKNTKPVVWTLHDMNPFTGLLHYDWMIGDIAQDGTPSIRNLTTTELQKINADLVIKQTAMFNTKNLTVIAPSKWLLNQSLQSSLFANYKHVHIPYGLNEQVFKPYTASFAKEFFGCPTNKTVLLFVAESLDNKRKGFAFLEKALSTIQHHDVVVATIGQFKSEIPFKQQHINLGVINNERLMALAYSMADFFVLPSLQDNLPNTMLESIMCGTPVVAFPVGGIVDVIQHLQNGVICNKISVNDLAEAIKTAIASKDAFNRTAIAAAAASKYKLSVQANAVYEVYKTLV